MNGVPSNEFIAVSWMREELQEIFRTVLGDDSIELDTDARRRSFRLGFTHAINTMFSVEQAFGVQFLGDEFARVQTIGQLETLVESNRAA